MRLPLLFDPGSGWEYGIGIDLVGKVIEEVTGQDLESYFRRHILDPLGMHDTSFLLLNDMARRLVGTHMRGPDGKPIAISIEPFEEAEFHTGGAGLFSTAPNYVTFTRMLLAGDTFNSVMFLPPRPAIAFDRVMHVGYPVAVVVADALDQAQDAAERVVVDYEPRPGVV